MYQKTIIIGRLGRDPESRFTPEGTQLTTFSVATDQRWTDQSGQQQQRTTWFKVTAWKRHAEICAEYLHKGSLVMVEGTLSESKPYQGRDGEWRASLDLRADNVKFLSPKAEGETAQAVAPTSASSSEEDIPF